ncbi:fimbrial protein [Siccibacter colletis]|uniref:fimbrial protein n=1 Tax=Siccibacter colletis TaxID=1505757 RepID=UPI0028BF0544|nr:fimbrial protein [Siccibacter colletis]WNN47002.1 fimbrial protein [Siccibacter colletis]
MKAFSVLLLLLTHLFFCSDASAMIECTFTGGSWSVSGAISFQPDDPVYTESDAIEAANTYHIECKNTDKYSTGMMLELYTRTSVTGQGYFPTDTNGISAQFYITTSDVTGFDSGCIFQDRKLVVSTSRIECNIAANGTASLDLKGYVKFVKMNADVSGGVIASIPQFKTNYTITNYSWNTPAPDLWNGTSNVVMNGVSCSIKNENVSVAIGDFKDTDFQQPGFTTGESAFTVGLTCDPGANINVTLHGKQNPDTSNTSVLALSDSDGGAAQGVGVQILYNDSPLNIDEKVPIKQSAGGDEVLPFSARYYQTRPQVTAGTANTVATLDLTYQ